MFVASDRDEPLLIPATACRGCVAMTRAHERLWLTDGDVASSPESMHKLRMCGALQNGMALPIHTGDSVVGLIHAQTENVWCIAKWHGSTHSHGRLCGEAHSRQTRSTSFSVAQQRRENKVKVAHVRPALTLTLF